MRKMITTLTDGESNLQLEACCTVHDRRSWQETWRLRRKAIKEGKNITEIKALNSLKERGGTEPECGLEESLQLSTLRPPSQRGTEFY